PKECLITPHQGEFEKLFQGVIPAPASPRLASTLARGEKAGIQEDKNWIPGQARDDKAVTEMARNYGINILLKGPEDVVCSPTECVQIAGGNAGMTKGGTGDVLAGLCAALCAKNDMYLSAKAGSYINKKAGESLFGKVGYYFNASDLVEEIPVVM